MGHEGQPGPDLGRFLARLEGLGPPARVKGRVQEITGVIVRATAPGVTLGELVEIEATGGVALPAQAVGFRGEQVVLMPLAPLRGVGPESPVRATGRALHVRCGAGLLGRVLDGLGRPLDEGPPLEGPDWRALPIDREPPPPLARARVTEALFTGVRAVDGLMTLGAGQRVGLFAGSGVGKSTFLGQLARGSEADVTVIALVGERGREVRDFLEGVLGPEGRARSVVVCATSDQPPMLRLMAAQVATTIAEHFRDQGARALLLVDSLTRLASAQREIGLAAGEPPVRQGYPPSVFSMMPRLLERAGAGPHGSITALYTVLTPGDELGSAVADEARSLLDGHLVLDRALAEQGRWPAVDPLRSLSRVMRAVTTPEHLQAAERVRAALATCQRPRELMAMGAWSPGNDPTVDRAMALYDDLEAFLRQPLDERTDPDETLGWLDELAEALD